MQAAKEIWGNLIPSFKEHTIRFLIVTVHVSDDTNPKGIIPWEFRLDFGARKPGGKDSFGFADKEIS